MRHKSVPTRSLASFMSNVILLGLTSLFADFSSEMIVPLMPFFVKSLGGAGLAIGLISGVGEAVAAILKVISGITTFQEVEEVIGITTW